MSVTIQFINMSMIVRKVGGKRKRSTRKVPRMKLGKTTLTSIRKTIVGASFGSSFTVPFNNTSGLNSSGFNSISFVCQQGGVGYSIGGGVISYSAATNASSFLASYDEYRITRFEVDVMFSNNSSGVVSSTTALPVWYSVVDYDDLSPLGSISQALAYSSCKIHQAGQNQQQNGVARVICDKPGVRVSMDTINTVFGTVASGGLQRSPWCNSDISNIEHNGIKIYIDPVVSSNNVVGQFIFTCRMIHEYKYTR